MKLFKNKERKKKLAHQDHQQLFDSGPPPPALPGQDPVLSQRALQVNERPTTRTVTRRIVTKDGQTHVTTTQEPLYESQEPEMRVSAQQQPHMRGSGRPQQQQMRDSDRQQQQQQMRAPSGRQQQPKASRMQAGTAQLPREAPSYSHQQQTPVMKQAPPAQQRPQYRDAPQAQYDDAPQAQYDDAPPAPAANKEPKFGGMDPAAMMARNTVTRELVKQFVADIWNRGDLDLIPQVCARGLRFNGSVGMDRVGHDGFRKMVMTIRSALEDYHCEIHSMVVEGNKAFCRMRFTGRHVGKLLGYDPSGKHVSWMGATEFTVQDGLIIKVWELGDMSSLEQQLRGEGAPGQGDEC